MLNHRGLISVLVIPLFLIACNDAEHVPESEASPPSPPAESENYSSTSQPLTGCQLISQPDVFYTPLSAWSSEFGSGTAIAYGDREACAKACHEWFGPGAAAPSRSWEHRGMQYYDEPFTTWSNITNGYATANAICTAQLWSPNAWSASSPDPWQCPPLRAQETKIFSTVCDGYSCREEYYYSTFSSRGTYACDDDLMWRRWATHVN